MTATALDSNHRESDELTEEHGKAKLLLSPLLQNSLDNISLPWGVIYLEDTAAIEQDRSNLTESGLKSLPDYMRADWRR